jgi:CubicO group peptidase (beta-lactamase class C family)
MRHLLNMSSGAEVDHARDPIRIDVPALLGYANARASRTDVEGVVRGWHAVREAPGARFNYNELCPLTIGMVIRHATGGSLAQFAEECLWRPLGAAGAVDRAAWAHGGSAGRERGLDRCLPVLG